MDPTHDGLRLHTREWGSGDRIAVLMHGMMADSGGWWRVGPTLAERGYRVVAVDLPGHGRSPRSASATMELFVASVLRSVPSKPELAIGHSMGGVVLAAAVEQLDPERVVYVDTTFGGDPETDPDELTRYYSTAKENRTLDYLKQERSWWSEKDMAVEVEAVKAFDVVTAVSLSKSTVGKDFSPTTKRPSLVVRADPSQYVTPEVTAEFMELGFSVRSVPGAGHSIWFGFFDEFVTALDDWI